MYLLSADVVYSKPVLSELHYILLEVTLMNCTNVLCLLTDNMKSEVCVCVCCQIFSKNFSKQHYFQFLEVFQQ